ncbi:MAG TPA: NUDIX domain-containing protein [Chloroflexia bacterium]|nr:NUDIX domain-containing protein [Chloroflexia bacterium]
MTSENKTVETLQPNAVIAVDVVLFTVRETPNVEEAWQVLLVQTDDPAFAGKWALPGVLVSAHETFDAAARRALRTKAGLDAQAWYLDQVGTFGDPGRDTRGRVVSVAHVALERSDELLLVPGGGVLRAEWVPVRQVPVSKLAFDHAAILTTGMHRIQSKLRYSWIAFQLLPEHFTIPELRAVYAAILDPAILRLNTSNFKKAFAALFASGALIPVGQRAERGRVGRPGDLYKFSGPLAGTWERELPWHERGDQ